MQADDVAFNNKRISFGGLLSVPEAAQYLGLGTGTMRNWLSMKRIDHVKVGRRTMVQKSALDRFIAAHTIRAKNDVSV